MYFYHIANPSGTPVEFSWATDVSAAWEKFCDAFQQPAGDSRFVFIEMAKMAGYDNVRIIIPDQFLNTAILGEKIEFGLPSRFEALDAAVHLLGDFINSAKDGEPTYREDYLKNAERIAKLASTTLDKMLK